MNDPGCIQVSIKRSCACSLKMICPLATEGPVDDSCWLFCRMRDEDVLLSALRFVRTMGGVGILEVMNCIKF